MVDKYADKRPSRPDDPPAFRARRRRRGMGREETDMNLAGTTEGSAGVSDSTTTAEDLARLRAAGQQPQRRRRRR